MAERSKAPDSRLSFLPIAQWERAFWSPNGGVGSNPPPDIIFFCRWSLFPYHNISPFVLRNTSLHKKRESLVKRYSSGCSFVRNFANFYRNIGILITNFLWRSFLILFKIHLVADLFQFPWLGFILLIFLAIIVIVQNSRVSFNKSWYVKRKELKSLNLRAEPPSLTY